MKYPASPCLGLLLAKGKSITKAIPLFHSAPTASVLDAAFFILEKTLLKDGDLKVVGVYEAPQNNDEGLSHVGQSIMSKILEASVVIKLYLTEEGDLSVRTLEWQSSGDLKKLKVEGAEKITSLTKGIEEGDHWGIVDFEDLSLIHI